LVAGRNCFGCKNECFDAVDYGRLQSDAKPIPDFPRLNDSLIGETIHERFPFRAGLRIRVPGRNPIWGGDGLLKLGTGGGGNRDASSRNEARSSWPHFGLLAILLATCWR
jgi:hypothetical protein